jgi:hypothetical protein
MAFSDYSTTAGSNTTIAGISIAEGCPSANINNAFRQLMADAKSFSLTISNPSGTFMPIAGGAFTGAITRSGSGGYLYHAASAQGQGPVYTLPSGSALPSSPVEGTVVFFYS